MKETSKKISAYTSISGWARSGLIWLSIATSDKRCIHGDITSDSTKRWEILDKLRKY